MKKESFGNSRKCLGQKNLGTSGFEIPEISLAQLILEQFTVNKDMLVDISDIKKDLNEEEKEIFDKIIKAMNAKSITVSMLNLAFWAILLYACFTILPLWAVISLIGIKLAIPVAKAVKYITVAKKLIKDDKNINKKLLSIRLKITNKEK